MRVFGVLLLLALSFAEAAWAAPAGVPHLADIGAKPEEIARVVGNRQFAILQHARPFEANGETYQARFAMGLAVVNAPAAHVRATVLDFAAYSEFVPQAEKVRVLKASKRELDVEYNLSIDLPIRNLRSRYVLRYRAEDDGSLVWHLVRGDMDANSGRWEFFPLQDGRTLLVYTQWSDMDSLGFTMRMMFRAQPDLRLAFPVATTTLVVEAIRRRAEGLPVTEPAPVTAPVSQPEIPLLSDPQSPVPLDALRFLSRSGTVIVIHPRQWIQTRAGPLDLVFVSSTAHVKTSAYTAQYYTRQFARYPEFFNQVRQTVHRNTAAGEFVDWELGLGFGFLAVGINFTLTYDEDPNGAILRYRTHAGDIEHVYGAWEWISLGEQESLAVYTTVSELGPDAPAIMKLVNLVPNRKITVGVSSSAIIAEKIRPWIEAQPAVTLQAD